jgi:hypothetical protein
LYTRESIQATNSMAVFMANPVVPVEIQGPCDFALAAIWHALIMSRQWPCNIMLFEIKGDSGVKNGVWPDYTIDIVSMNVQGEGSDLV